MRNHEIPGWPLSQRKLRKYVHTKFINRCHAVAIKVVDVAEKASVERRDMPRYNCAGVHKCAGFFNCMIDRLYHIIIF